MESHPLGEMAIHSNLVDADRADNHGYDGEANDNDNRTASIRPMWKRE